MTVIEWQINKAKRRMQRRREKNLAIQWATKAAAVVLLAGAAMMCSGAYSKPTEIVHECYIIEEGDTLWQLTERYREKDVRDPYILSYLDEIKALNPHVADRRLIPRQEIHFEYQVSR